MDYEKLHKDTINKLQQMVSCGKITIETACGICADFVPESEDERIKKEIMDFIDTKTIDSDERRNRWFSYLEKYKPISFTSLEDTKVKMSLMQYISELNQDVVHLHPGIETCNEWIAWLEKQDKQPSAIRWYDVSLIPQEMEELLVEWDSEDATWHEIAFYHADTKTFWDGTRQVENVTRWCYIIDLLEKQGDANKEYWRGYREGKQEILNKYAELEKQSEKNTKQVSIWKHWKDGIAGNGDSEPIYLIKNGYTYSLSPFLSYECDYIELSEFDKLMIEKQGEQKSYGQRKECLDCQFNYAGECKGSCTMKRSEQKPVDNIEPKFKVGDWITDGNNALLCVEKFEIDYGYELKATDGQIFHFVSSNLVDANYHLWTIQDAKDGDVLQLGKVTAIFQEYIGNGNCKCYCSVCNGEFEIPSQDGADNSYGCHDAIPATKEQRDTLIKAMADAGYTFDFEKKELRKLKFRVGDEVITENEESLTVTRIDKEGYWSNDLFICDFDSECIWDLVEQKPTWSEEDERNMQNIDSVLFYDKTLPEDTCVKLRNFLKSLKQRIGG